MKRPDIDSGHIPVLLSDFSSLLPNVSGIWIDGTFGFGGYSKRLLGSGASKVIAIDLDPDVLSRAYNLEQIWPNRFKILTGNFCQMGQLVTKLGVSRVSGVIMDLGLSSMQLDAPIRGFSLKNNGPLDMRMSKKGPSAKDFINQANESLISDVLLKYGEERHAKAIAKSIVTARKKNHIESTYQLVSLIEKVLGFNKRYKIHPATRTFQAIRIAINNELENLIEGLVSANRLLGIGGLFSVITFHSLEDRIVKRFFNLQTQNDNSLNEIKCIGGDRRPLFKKINKRPVIANRQELDMNPRARSAKLRIVKKVVDQFVSIEPSNLGLPSVSSSLRDFQCD